MYTTLYFRNGLENNCKIVDISTEEGLRFEIVQSVIETIGDAGLSVDDFAIYLGAKGKYTFMYGDESIEVCNENCAGGSYFRGIGMFDIFTEDPVKGQLLSKYISENCMGGGN